MRETETARLKLRRVGEDDIGAIFEGWANDPEVTKYLTWHPHKSIEDTRMVMDYWLSEYNKESCFRWGIELKENGTLIGMIDVVGYEGGVPVIGYCSARKYWNRGYMTEALRAVANELFENGFSEIKAEAVEENGASNRVIQKAGFEYVESRNSPLSLVKPEMVTLNSYRLKKPQ
ncbi:MAG: GNAT family N-acetyltransferase [Ruminiclostridium sp.]|nr:GNAT family N-acetyltransferase [Ruminiclostridium sp.]